VSEPAPHPPSGLPIDAALPALRQALAAHTRVVLQAPPGAGKSTVVPLALLDEPWMAGRRLLMLEPRRVAARAVAARLAAGLHEPVGRRVGQRMRLDTRVSQDTRIEVVTEGVLTRMLQSDPALEGVGLVIFDEFHERSLNADLGLALALDAQAQLAPELKLLVMSATLDVAAVAARLGDAPVVGARGRSFEVVTRFAGRGAPLLPGAASGESVERVVAAIVQRALAEEPGDALVFLPGAREIRRVQSLLEGALPRAVRVLPLYGDLPPSAQAAALAPGPSGTRRVVLATNIAETSLTIEGVRIVVDSGLARHSVFDPVTGMSRLDTVRISRASAEQRQGRAGRLEPGVCYRAWSEGAQRSLAPFSLPEILETDLTPLALELAAWGTRAAGELTFLDPPPAALLDSARDLLHLLGALQEGRVTAHGREMAALGVHPRLAHMLLAARGLGCVPLAARLAALLSERDLLRGADADLDSRLALLAGAGMPADVDRGALERVRRLARELARQVSHPDAPSHVHADAPLRAHAHAHAHDAAEPEVPAHAADSYSSRAGVLLAFAYPDRIALRRPGMEGRYLLANGRGAVFAAAQSLGRQELIVAVDLDDRDRDARILLAAPLARAELERHFAAQLRAGEEVAWDARTEAVVARRVLRLGLLVLEEKPLPEMPAEAALAAMLAGLRQLGLPALPWDEETRELQARMEFVRRHLIAAASGEPDADGSAAATGPDADGSVAASGPDMDGGSAVAAGPVGGEWPRVDDDWLAAHLHEWLAPWLNGVTRRTHLARLPLAQALKGLLSHAQQQRLEAWAPTHLPVPGGSRIRVDYRDELAPVIAVRLQEVFGLSQTPRLADGRVPVTFKLLSPAQRPVQVTRDLASFWRTGYAAVRKDLRGRYPRHYWPEDPLVAQPTRRVRPGGTPPRR